MENESLENINKTEQSTEPTIETPTEATESKTKTWLKRVGIGGFLFFLGKGLLWLFLGKTALQALCN